MPAKKLDISDEERRVRNNAAKARWRQRNPDHDANYNRWSNHGLTPQQYQGLLIEQKGVCALCSRPERQQHRNSKRVASLCVDHDHKTNKNRGLLCRACNQALGLFEENVDVFLKAIEYIRKHGENHVC
jgi:hypothetical protein